MPPKWICKHFEDLTLKELYTLLRLRNEVFIVEQNCPYQDADNKDDTAFHLMGWCGKELAAYCRIIPAGISYAEASIGRVLTSPHFRAKGFGRELMRTAIEQVYTLFGQCPIRIGAQLYLKKFYASLGFKETGDVYLEDGIEHIEMLKP